LKKSLYIISLVIFHFLPAGGQVNGHERLVQLSGIITDVSARPVQGAVVISKKLRRGSLSEITGIYSITTLPGDTVYFRALGYKRYHTLIPESFREKHCMVDIELEPDTLQISEVTILPWKSYPEFLRDVTREKPVDPLVENMAENMASIYVALSNDYPRKLPAEVSFRQDMERNFDALTRRGMYPVNNLLNPFAWAKFFSGVKNGLLKNHTYKKPEPAKIVKKKKRLGKK
jgi:hypothetical protein